MTTPLTQQDERTIDVEGLVERLQGIVAAFASGDKPTVPVPADLVSAAATALLSLVRERDEAREFTEYANSRAGSATGRAERAEAEARTWRIELEVSRGETAGAEAERDEARAAAIRIENYAAEKIEERKRVEDERDAARAEAAELREALRKLEPEHVTIGRVVTPQGDVCEYFCSTCSERENEPHSPACPFALLNPQAESGEVSE